MTSTHPGGGQGRFGRRAALALLAAPALPRVARAAETVRIGQATTSLSFLPLWMARADDGFAQAGMDLQWAAVPGGDPAALAALDAGDLDLAAVGSDTMLAAVAKGQPFLMIQAVMARTTLDLVVSEALMRRRSVAPDSPLPARLEAMRDAVVGVSAIGGAQDRAVRWLAQRGGLDPRRDVQIAQVGGPPALQAALENGRIDAFLLSPPEAGIAAAAHAGRALVRMAQDFPELASVPFLVLAAKKPVPAAAEARIVRAVAVLQRAAARIAADPYSAAIVIGQKFFPRIDTGIMQRAVLDMAPGIGAGGRLQPDQISVLLHLQSQLGVAGVDTLLQTEGGFWTNRYVELAQGH